MVKSISCPTALTTGTGLSAIARATTSSLNSQQILQAAPAARHHDHIYRLNPGVSRSSQHPHRLRDLGSRALSLHADWKDDDLNPSLTTVQDIEKILDGSAGGMSPRRSALGIAAASASVPG